MDHKRDFSHHHRGWLLRSSFDALRVEVPRFSLDSFQQRRSSALQGQCIRTLCVVSCAATWFSHQTGSFQRQMPVECDACHKRSVQARTICFTVFMYERSYLTGGGRGEITASDGNERGAHTSGTRRRGTLTTLATKNQNGIKKRKRRPATGGARAASKAIAR